jgi:hypothetical protein
MSDPKHATVPASKTSTADAAAVPERTAMPPPWLRLPPPAVRPLKVYALDPSAGNYVGNQMTINVKWEQLGPGPVGAKVAVVDYDPVNRIYYPPVDLDDPYVLIRGGLDPTESDPRFHQQMVYAVATETIEKFESALGRRLHWHRAERVTVGDDEDTPPADAADRSWRKADDIWVLHLYPHAMVQENAFYSRQAKGILFGYFKARTSNQGRNLPGQRVFTCLSHDIIAHETTHAIVDGIRAYFTEPTNPDVLAFHEGFADLAALFQHFSHRAALLDTLQKTGGRLYDFELRPVSAPLSEGDSNASGHEPGGPAFAAQVREFNPLIQLAQQFGEARGGGHGLRSALGTPPDSNDYKTRVNDPHFRGSILVAAVFDAYFTIYVQRTSNLFRVFRAGGGNPHPDQLPVPLAELLAEAAANLASDFFQVCARGLDYCPPVDVTFGDYLRALITVDCDLRPADTDVRDALMQAFRLRGIYAEDASFFSQDALCWPEVTHEFPPLAETEVIVDKKTREHGLRPLVFGNPNGLSSAEKDINGQVLRQYARAHAAALGLDPDPDLPQDNLLQVPSFHPTFRIAPDGGLRLEMVVEVVQTRRVPFDARFPHAGSFPLRGGATLIISAPQLDYGKPAAPQVRFAIRKPLVGPEGDRRLAGQREYLIATGLAGGNTDDPKHFQADFNLLHGGSH